MKNDVAIKITDLSKVYKLGSISTQTFFSDLKVFFKKLYPYSKVNKIIQTNEIYALKNINLSINKGEILGIIGRNGAGKSTLLKVLSRITSPTFGEVRINGRVSSLLEVGTGFHPELTGRENIFLNGTILGMTSSEVKSKIDEIISFSEIEKFIDTPVKRYSSGMRVRLGFSVAAHLDSEILIIDEVLAVGDAEFQKKCLGKMNKIADNNRTILFVSHNMNSVKNLCTRSIVINNGSIIYEGNVDDSIKYYLKTSNISEATKKRKKINHTIFRELLEFEKVLLKDKHGEVRDEFEKIDDIIIEIYFNAFEKINNPKFWVELDSELGRVTKANMLVDGLSLEFIKGKGRLKLQFKNIKLSPQLFTLNIGLRDNRGEAIASTVNNVAGFTIIKENNKINKNLNIVDSFIKGAPVLFSYEWEYKGNILKNELQEVN